MVLKNKNIVTGGVILLILMAGAAFAPYLAPYDPLAFNLHQALNEPSFSHPFGTDYLGRDILSRVIYGTRVSLTIAFAVMVITGFFGTILGLLAGYYRTMESVIMRLMDGLMAFPSILLALAIVAALGSGIENLILAFSITFLPRVTRTVRGTVLVVKELEFVEAAKAMGASDVRIMLIYILPQCISPLIIRLTLTMAVTILEESSLTFLGLGMSPEIPTWGIIISEAKKYITTSPYNIVIPGLVIMAAVYAFNTLGDGLRDYLDPKLREKQ
jgi:ABC-type dipeptide/oligopeptide/nickel transport system permease subunit